MPPGSPACAWGLAQNFGAASSKGSANHLFPSRVWGVLQLRPPRLSPSTISTKPGLLGAGGVRAEGLRLSLWLVLSRSR